MHASEQRHVTPPFPAFPSTSRYVELGSIAEAMTRVCRSIDAREGVSLVVGPPGTGKSLLCSLLVKHYSETHDVVVLGETPIPSSAAYQRSLLHHLGSDYRSLDESELQLALVDRVSGSKAKNEGLLIIVDEAQALSADVLESIRMSTNIHRRGEPRVFAVVVGGPKLDDTLTSPALEGFTQRIAARCYLHPMNGEETREYITKTVESCGADAGSTISTEAISSVHHACLGVPRLVNQLMTEAIDIAEESDESLITDVTIGRAWAQLQQLPSPMIESPKIKGSGSLADASSSVEFGELDESEDVCELDPSSEPTLEDELLDEVEAERVAAEWIEREYEPGDQEPEPVRVLDTQALFGDFEEEEEVSIGAKTASTKESLSETIESSIADEPAFHHEIDNMMDQQIVGISDSPLTAELYANETAEPAEQVEQVDCSQDCEHCQCRGEQEERSVQPAVVAFHIHSNADIESRYEEEHENEPETEPAKLQLAVRSDRSDIHVGDDSDLLIIEEDLVLSAEVATATKEKQDTGRAIDFRAMLNRMRTGTEG